jgi:hypothetical protein
MTSIHDHFITELAFKVNERQIRIRTAFPEKTGPDFTEVVFEGVEAYLFNGDAFGTILFDIEEVDPLMLYRDWAKELQDTFSRSGGSASWVESEASAAEYLSGSEVRGYEVSCSIGLDGVVWARQLTIRAIDAAGLRG